MEIPTPPVRGKTELRRLIETLEPGKWALVPDEFTARRARNICRHANRKWEHEGDPRRARTGRDQERRLYVTVTKEQR